jgi:thiamine monophosphate kinase
MRVSDVGEFGLIRLLSSTLEQMGVQHNLLVGMGDDAAAWKSVEFTTLATTDTLVEGVHFTEQCTW